MRFEVPQFIEIEDKIFGPFTWRQFVYICGGAGVGIILFLVAPIIIFGLIGIPAAGLGFLLAFYPVNNRPFSIFLESVLSFYKSDHMYHWRKKNANVYRAESHVSEAPPVNHVLHKKEGSISSLARQLELNALQKTE